MKSARLLAVSLAVGAAAFAASLLFWPIGTQPPMWLVKRYEALSLDPFQRSDYSHRILAPLLAHLLHLEGERFRYLTLGCSVLLLAGIYAYCRRAGVAAAGSALVVLAFALSRTVGNSSVIPGLTDSLTYLLLLLALMASARPYAFWALIALNLANHEQIAFMLPWLLYVRREAAPERWRSDLALVLAVLGAYAVARASLGSRVVELHARFARRPLPDYLAEYGMVWWFLWTSLGCLLALLWAYAASGKRERNGALLCLLCAAAPSVIAWDPYRYIHLSFGVFLFAAVWFLRPPGRLPWFAALLGGNVLIYFLSTWLLQRATERLAAGCGSAQDPDRCIHLSSMWFTLPSLFVLPCIAWLARRLPRAESAAAPGAEGMMGAR
jgi:hypothetical protein